MVERFKNAHSFSSPEEEIAYLRREIAKKERDVVSRNLETDNADYETIAKRELKNYSEFTPELVLHKKYQIKDHELASTIEQASTAGDQVGEILEIAEGRGIRNAFIVLEKLNSAFLTDEVHRALIKRIKSGHEVNNVKEGTPLWSVLHMTLFEVSLPEITKDEHEKTLKELISSMEQFYAGMQSVSVSSAHNHFTLEVAVSDKSDDIVFYAAVPTVHIDLFEKQLLSLFSDARIVEDSNVEKV